ncbi:hypothetical protein L0F63_003492, partial [Massospora cicadina]
MTIPTQGDQNGASNVGSQSIPDLGGNLNPNPFGVQRVESASAYPVNPTLISVTPTSAYPINPTSISVTPTNSQLLAFGRPSFQGPPSRPQIGVNDAIFTTEDVLLWGKMTPDQKLHRVHTDPKFFMLNQALFRMGSSVIGKTLTQGPNALSPPSELQPRLGGVSGPVPASSNLLLASSGYAPNRPDAVGYGTVGASQPTYPQVVAQPIQTSLQPSPVSFLTGSPNPAPSPAAVPDKPSPAAKPAWCAKGVPTPAESPKPLTLMEGPIDLTSDHELESDPVERCDPNLTAVPIPTPSQNLCANANQLPTPSGVPMPAGANSLLVECPAMAVPQHDNLAPVASHSEPTAKMDASAGNFGSGFGVGSLTRPSTACCGDASVKGFRIVAGCPSSNPVEADGLIHIYPDKKSPELGQAVPEPKFKPTSRHHLMILVRLTTLYTQKLNEMGRGPMRQLESGAMVVDLAWKSQHRQMLVSAIFCLETMVRFMDRLRCQPQAYAQLKLSPANCDKIEIQARVKLSTLLLDYTASHRQAESHLSQALALSQKSFSPKEYPYGIKLQLARSHRRTGLERHAEAILKEGIAEAQSVGLVDWVYAMSFELASLQRHATEVLNRVHAMASASNDHGIVAAASLKLVVHHLQHRDFATLAGLLPQLKVWFDSACDSSVVLMRPYIHLLSTVHLAMAGDLAAATAAVSDFRPLVDPWTDAPEESEFHIKFSLASQPSELRLSWMSRRQFIILAYLASGLSLKPAFHVDQGPRFLRESILGAIANFGTQHAGSFLLGSTARRQRFYVCVLVVCHLHLAEVYTAREDFGQAHESLKLSAEVCARNGLWHRFGPLILHAKGLLAQAQSKFRTAFALYQAALKSAEDCTLKLAVTLNALTLTLSHHASLDPGVAPLFASIQAANPEPRLPPLDAALCLFAVLFAEGMVEKKNCLARAAKFAKASTNSQMIGLCTVLTGVLVAATQPAVTAKLLSQATASYRKFGCDIGSITTLAFACQLLAATRDQDALLATRQLLEACSRSYREKLYTFDDFNLVTGRSASPSTLPTSAIASTPSTPG